MKKKNKSFPPISIRSQFCANSCCITLPAAQTSIRMRDSQTGAVICRVCFKVISAPRSSAVSDLSPRPSAKRPTGRNQPKLPLLIRRDRWIQSRSLFSSGLFFFFFVLIFPRAVSITTPPPLHSPHSIPARKQVETEREGKRAFMWGVCVCGGAALTTATRYCINHRSDLVFTFGLLWLNSPPWCSSFTGDRANTNCCFSASNPPLSFRPSIQITVAVEKILH